MINISITPQLLLGRSNRLARCLWLLESGEILDMGLVRILSHSLDLTKPNPQGKLQLLFDYETSIGNYLFTQRIVNCIKEGGSVEKLFESAGVSYSLWDEIMLEWDVKNVFSIENDHLPKYMIKPGPILIAKPRTIENILGIKLIRRVLPQNIIPKKS